MTTAAIILAVYLLYSFVFPVPYWPSFFRLCFYLFAHNRTVSSRIRLFRHLLSMALYSFVGFFLLPLDLLLYIFSFFLSSGRPPVFICGTPRSGSTLLHRLLVSSSSQLFGVTHLEWRLPSASLQYLLTLLGLKKWLSSRNYWASSPVSETVSRMHSASLGDFEEDAILFEERCAHHPYQYLHVPLDKLCDVFSRPKGGGGLSSGFAEGRLFFFYRFFVQSISLAKRPASRFVSKEVASNQRLDRYFRFCQGSKFIIITRSPSAYLSSLKPLLELSTQSKTLSTDHFSSTSWWSGWYNWLVWQASTVASFYSTHSASGRVIHVRYEDLVDNPELVIRRLLLFLDEPPGPGFQPFISSFVESQSRRKRGYSYPLVSCSTRDFEFFNQTFYS